MLNALQVTLVLITALMIGVADALIKKIAAAPSFAQALRDPWMLAILFLYFLQVVIIVYIFTRKGDLLIYGNIFIIFYSVTTVLLGLLIFKENLSLVKIIGIILALAGAFLINR
jgi:multidrug transporter EmrE-like cation transporter